MVEKKDSVIIRIGVREGLDAKTVEEAVKRAVKCANPVKVEVRSR